VQGGPEFIANLAPPWTSPYLGPDLGCSSILEVADPLEALGVLGVLSVGSSTIYGLADEAYLSWFARQSPSTGFDGAYDAGGVFSTYSSAC
jgi:hypothetical protein